MKFKKFVIVSLCAALFGCLLLSAAFISMPIAYAESQENFSAARYTDDDRLLNPDGTLSNKTIEDFADEVKAAKHNEIIEDITKVIPYEYLISNDCSRFRRNI